MPFTFANPLALWALLGLPAVVAIHFLQRRSQLQTVTTLFLLEQMRRESETGHRFERLRTSIPLWLQLLMVLLLAWLLAEPRWLKKDSVQRVAVVLDASASMQAFREKVSATLSLELATLARASTATEYTLLSSDPEAPGLYHGASRDELATALAGWEPLLGAHDFTPALRTARSLAGDMGVVVLVTDHDPGAAPPYNAKVLAVGEPKENCGFAGVSIEEQDGQPMWKAVVRNYGKGQQVRDWWIETGGQKTAPARLDLPSGKTRTIQGAFPVGADALTLVLAPDALTIDDRVPLVRPHPKVLELWLPAAVDEAGKTLVDVFGSFDHTAPATDPAKADLVVAIYNPLAPGLPDANACVFAADPQPGAAYSAGTVIAEADPLLDVLNWQSLLVRDTLGLPTTKDDRGLLWQGERPLIALRTTAAGRRQLLFHFDLQSSNARKLPALAVLIHRFLETLRHDKIATESANFETHQHLAIAHRTDKDAPPLELIAASTPADSQKSTIRTQRSAILKTPGTPGFFDAKQGDTILLRAAARFADPREADFSTASSKNDLAGLDTTLVERHSEADANWRSWTLLTFAALLASWWYARGRPTPAAAAGPVRLAAPQAPHHL